MGNQRKPFRIQDYLTDEAQRAPVGPPLRPEHYDYEAPQSDPWDASNEPDAFSPAEMIKPGAEDVSDVDDPALDAWIDDWRAVSEEEARGASPSDGTVPEEAEERDALRYHEGQTRMGLRKPYREDMPPVGPNSPPLTPAEYPEDWDRRPYNEAEVFGSDPDADNDAMGDNDADGDGAYVDMDALDHIPAFADQPVGEARAAHPRQGKDQRQRAKEWGTFAPRPPGEWESLEAMSDARARAYQNEWALRDAREEIMSPHRERWVNDWDFTAPPDLPEDGTIPSWSESQLRFPTEQSYETRKRR